MAVAQEAPWKVPYTVQSMKTVVALCLRVRVPSPAWPVIAVRAASDAPK